MASYRNRDALPIPWDVKKPVNGGLLAPRVAVGTHTPSSGDTVEILFRAEASFNAAPILLIVPAEGVPFTAKMDTVLSGEGGYRYILETTGWKGGEARVTIEASYLSSWDFYGNYFYSTLEYDIPLWIQSGQDAVGENRPVSFALLHNFPNPFNGETEIAFDLPVKGRISVEVYDALGRRVRTIFSGVQEAGRHTERINMEDAASGLYFIRLTAPQGRRTQKMLLLR